jgi:hypothetical protein
MKIVTDSTKYDWNGEDIFLDEVSMKYIQAPDCTENKDNDDQELIITTRDGGGGKFLNLKTNNWSISGLEDLKLVIEDFNKRIENESTDNT